MSAAGRFGAPRAGAPAPADSGAHGAGLGKHPGSWGPAEDAEDPQGVVDDGVDEFGAIPVEEYGVEYDDGYGYNDGGGMYADSFDDSGSEADPSGLGYSREDDDDPDSLNAMGRCIARCSSCKCTGGCTFAVVWTILQLCVTLPTLVPATVLLVLFGLLYRGPQLAFRAYVAMSISRRVGCNVRVLFYVLFPFGLLAFLALAPALAGIWMLSFVITKTYYINSIDVVQVQRTTSFHLIALVLSGVTGPCSDFLRQANGFLLGISLVALQALRWLGDQRPNRHRVWPEPFDIRVDWFVISVLLAVLLGPAQALVFAVVGVLAFLPVIVTAVRRVYADPEHFGLGSAEIQKHPVRVALAALALLLLPFAAAAAVFLLPVLGLALGVKSAFVAFWSAQDVWRGGFILWNDFGPDRFTLPLPRRNSFTDWEEKQAADAAAKAAEADDDAAHDGDAAAPSPPHDADADPSAIGLDAKSLTPRSPATASPGPCRAVTGRCPNVRGASHARVVIPVNPGLPRRAAAVRPVPRRAAAPASAPASPARGRTPRARPEADSTFDFAADPVATPGAARKEAPQPAATPAPAPASSAAPAAADPAAADPAPLAPAPHAADPAATLPPDSPEDARPPLPRGIAASVRDLLDDQAFLAKVLAFTILDIPFWDELAAPASTCGGCRCSGDLAGAWAAAVFWGLLGLVAMPLFGLVWGLITVGPILVRVVAVFVNPALFPVLDTEAESRCGSWAWYLLVAWPLYLLVLLLLPAGILVLLAFYLLFCLVEGARVGPLTAADNVGDTPFPRAGRALGRTMRDHDHAVFRFLHGRLGTNEVPFTLIGYSMSLMCDELYSPSEAEQTAIDETVLRHMHGTTARARLQGGIADGAAIRRFDPAARGMAARRSMGASFLPAPQPKRKQDDEAARHAVSPSKIVRRKSRHSNKPRIITQGDPDAAAAPGGDGAADGAAAGAAGAAAEAGGDAKATSPAAAREPAPPRSATCCPCCDPSTWETSLHVDELPRVSQDAYEGKRRREANQAAGEAAAEAGDATEGDEGRGSEGAAAAPGTPAAGDAAAAAEDAKPGDGGAARGSPPPLQPMATAVARRVLEEEADEDDAASFDSGSSDDLGSDAEDDAGAAARGAGEEAGAAAHGAAPPPPGLGIPGDDDDDVVVEEDDDVFVEEDDDGASADDVILDEDDEDDDEPVIPARSASRAASRDHSGRSSPLSSLSRADPYSPSNAGLSPTEGRGAASAAPGPPPRPPRHADPPQHPSRGPLPAESDGSDEVSTGDDEDDAPAPAALAPSRGVGQTASAVSKAAGLLAGIKARRAARAAAAGQDAPSQ